MSVYCMMCGRNFEISFNWTYCDTVHPPIVIIRTALGWAGNILWKTILGWKTDSLSPYGSFWSFFLFLFFFSHHTIHLSIFHVTNLKFSPNFWLRNFLKINFCKIFLYRIINLRTVQSKTEEKFQICFMKNRYNK